MTGREERPGFWLGTCQNDGKGVRLSSRSALIRDLVLSKNGDAGSESGMTGRRKDCHPVVLLYGISLFSSVSKQR